MTAKVGGLGLPLNKDIAIIFFALMSEGRHGEALEALADFELDFDRDLLLILKKTDAQMRVGRVDDAINILLSILGAGIKDLRVYLELGRAHELKLDVDAAIEWYNRANFAQPRNMWPYFRLGQVYRRQHNYTAAIEILSLGFNRCKGHVTKEEISNCLKDLCDARALLILQAKGVLGQLVSSRPCLGRVLDRALHVSLLKDEEDIIYASLDGSYRNGLRRFILADNGSRDATRQEIDRFIADHGDCCVYVVSDPVREYYQAAKTMGLVYLAQSIFTALGSPVDWVFAIDGDEILAIEDQITDLYEIVSKANDARKNLITYMWCRASSRTIFEEPPTSKSLDEMFPIITSYRNNPVRKIAFRYSESVSVEQGNHFAEGVENPDQILVGAEYALHMLHYGIRSVHHVKNKIINGNDALRGASGLERTGSHWRKDFEAYVQRGDEFFREKVKRYIDSNAAIFAKDNTRVG